MDKSMHSRSNVFKPFLLANLRRVSRAGPSGFQGRGVRGLERAVPMVFINDSI